MKLQLSFELELDQGPVQGSDIASNIETHLEELKALPSLNGRIIIRLNGKDCCGDYSEPLLRLLTHWTQKLQWIIGGDTETIPFRNSESCFAFEGAGDGVEFSYFEGSELEVETYIVEPTPVRLANLATESLSLAESVQKLIAAISAADADAAKALGADMDCRDLKIAIGEAKTAWHDHELHQRR